MARTRAQSIKVRKVRATVGSASRDFSSQRAADEWVERVRKGHQRKVIEAIEIAVEDYELRHEQFARNDEDPDDPDSWTGVRLIERPFALYGTASVDETISEVEERLRIAASARRERSYRWYLHYLHKESLDQQSRTDMPKSAREYAAVVLSKFRAELDEAHISFVRRKEIEALPTIAELHDEAVQADLVAGRISNGTAAAAKGFAPWRASLGQLRLDKVTEDHFQKWLQDQLAQEVGGVKRLRNAIGEIARIHKHSRREPSRRAYSSAFRVEDLRLLLTGVVRADDGAHGRRVLKPEEIQGMFKACLSDVERATLALALLGVRTLGEVAGASWESVFEELGSRWLQVDWTVVDGKDGRMFLEKPKDVKARSRKNKKIVRHVPITKSLWELLKVMEGRGRFILGEGDSIVSPRFVERTLNKLIDRAAFREPGVSPYSLRHTVLDRTEALAGKSFRDLLHRGDDDPSIASRVYTHADATRFRKKLLVRNGVTCSDVMPWAKPGFFE